MHPKIIAASLLVRRPFLTFSCKNVFIGQSGHIAVVDTGRHGVRLVSPGCPVVKEWEFKLPDLVGAVYDSNSEVSFPFNPSWVYAIKKDGTELWKQEIAGHVKDVMLGRSNNIYVLSRTHVLEMDAKKGDLISGAIQDTPIAFGATPSNQICLLSGGFVAQLSKDLKTGDIVSAVTENPAPWLGGVVGSTHRFHYWTLGLPGSNISMILDSAGQKKMLGENEVIQAANDEAILTIHNRTGMLKSYDHSGELLWSRAKENGELHPPSVLLDSRGMVYVVSSSLRWALGISAASDGTESWRIDLPGGGYVSSPLCLDYLGRLSFVTTNSERWVVTDPTVSTHKRRTNNQPDTEGSSRRVKG